MKGTINDVYVVAYGRSAIGRSGKKGALRNMHPVELGGRVLEGILKKIPQLKTDDIEDVIVGCAQPEGLQGYNMSRLIALRAGLGHGVPGMTINRFCSSGLQSIAIAASMIASGQSDVIAAGGVESMSTIPMFGDVTPISEAGVREIEVGAYMPMGLTAENVAANYGLTREELDSMAVESHRKAAVAQDDGKFDEEIIPLDGVDDDGNLIIFDKDQGIRRNVTMESLSQLKTVFKEDGVVTAGSSSQTSDGAAFVVLMSKEKVDELGIKPIAKFIGFQVAGCDPTLMGLGPIYAVPKVMKKTCLSVNDMDVIEINEAFAAQAIPCINELKFDLNKVNPNGGALALGHPLGATGAVLSCKALSELERNGGKYALVTMCIGGGMGAAGIYEKC
ncbi:MAG: 3-ketoacyl-CoA thiolase [Sedimentibacter sp.]|nr:3-ketoacyl-CoA thiolase [Sedimentibacter sp.]